jgi:hypothetical protein
MVEDIVGKRLPEKAEGEKDAKSEKESVNRQQELARAMNSSRESLGDKVIEGLDVKGEIHRWTIPTGAIGNDRPIEVSVEAWYSPDLQTEVIRNRIDPRFGESQYRLTNIQRAEPSGTGISTSTGSRFVPNPARLQDRQR